MKPSTLSPLLAFTFLLAALPVRGAPYISEFQADNQDTITDEDGATSDWIEIYNPDATAVSLAGMALTDDPLLPQKWLIPAVNLAARSRLLIWASVKNRTNPAAPLHTNFDLAAGGEYLALMAADGTTKLTEFNLYPSQPPDRSYGSTNEVTTTETLVTSGAACKWLVPAGLVAGWETTGFVDTPWTSALTGIGYERDAAGAYGSLIGAGGDVNTAMYSIRGTCYVRLPFTFSHAVTEVTALKLRMKYDDGFAAFLNGTRLNPPTAAATNAPAALAFNSLATTTHDDSVAVIFETFDVSGQKNLLLNGSNLLAIQVLNQSTTSSDLIMIPEIEVTRVDSTGPLLTGYFAKPTPNTANSVPPVDDFVESVDFDVHRGIYTRPQTVTLTCPTVGAQIRFTTNGSPPTATTGTAYSGPVTISTSTVLRASGFVTGWEPSKPKTHTYVFGLSAKNQSAAPAGYPTTWGNVLSSATGLPTAAIVPADYRMDPLITGSAIYGPLIVPAITDTLPILCLTTAIGGVFDFNNGIYCNKRIIPGIELATSLEYFDPHGTENWQEDAGLRMHGGDAPFEHPKKPFRVYFRKEYGNGRLKKSLFPGSPVDSFDKLQLRPGGHDGWSVPFGSGEGLARHATYCRDRFLRQTELDMGRLSHRGKYVHLFINGLYWGLYDVHEVQSKEYWADHKGGEEDDWDVLEHSNVNNPLFDIVDGQDAAMNATLALVRPASNAASQATYDALAQYMDYDEFIDNMIVQMWGGQNDWMGPVFRGTPGIDLTDATRFTNKNWQAGRRSRGPEVTKFFWQTWDAEISMGCSLTSLVPVMRVTNFNHTLVGTPTTDIPHATGQPGSPGPAAEIWYALRKHNPAFRMKVADRLNRHFFNGGAMSTANNLARMQSFRDLLDLPIVAESARWGDVNYNNPVGTTVTFTRDDHWRTEMNWFRDTYIPTRNATLLTQMGAIGMWPSVTAPAFAQHGGSVPSGYQLPITDPNAAGGTIYYTLDGTDPMGEVGAGGTITLLGPGVGTIASYKVPTEAYTTNSWKSVTAPWEVGVSPPPPAGRTPEQEIATWSTGPVGLGFDANPTFGPHIATTVTGMQGVRGSLYVRIPFSVTAEQKAAMTALTLRLKYDDGAYIWLNSPNTPVQPNFRLNANPTATPNYTDVATSIRPDTDAVNYSSLDLTAQLPNLTVGSSNLLAIQGLNVTIADEDFLCVPELVGTTPATTPPSATALSYSGPVSLPQSGTVKARVLRNGVWSPLTEASYIVGVPASATNLTITEFSYNPVASAAEILAGFTDQMFEYVELMNISASPVELTGCRFDDGISFDFSINSSVQTISPGGRILLVSNLAAFNARHPGVPVAGVFANASNLSNSGERLELLSAAGPDIFDFVYDDTAPWPVSPDAGGTTLVLINPAANPDPGIAANWRASVSAGGSPGGSDADSFTAWASRNSVAGGMSDDSNNNGLTNLAEYGLGLTPDSGETDGIFSAQFETVTVAGTPDTYLVLRLRRSFAADDVTVIPEMSTDMVTWTPLTDAVPPDMPYPDGTEDIARRSPLPVAGGARVYVRVNVTTR